MKLVYRKLELDSLEALTGLVRDHAEAMEPGLRVLDVGLRIGKAAVDLVALDARSRLTLVALGVTADDVVLLKMLEAYVWCLENTDTVRRLYPRADADELPRMIVVAGRYPDGFVRKATLLRLPALNLFEFRYLDLGGAPTFYLEEFHIADAPVAPAPPRPKPVRPVRAVPPPAVPAAPPPAAEPVPAPVPPAVEPKPAASRRLHGDSFDESKVRTVREYLQREFPYCTIYDYYSFDREAQVFQLQDNQSRMAYLAALSGDFLTDRREGEIPVYLDSQCLASLMRDAGSTGVFVTNFGVRFLRQ